MQIVNLKYLWCPCSSTTEGNRSSNQHGSNAWGRTNAGCTWQYFCKSVLPLVLGRACTSRVFLRCSMSTTNWQTSSVLVITSLTAIMKDKVSVWCTAKSLSFVAHVTKLAVNTLQSMHSSCSNCIPEQLVSSNLNLTSTPFKEGTQQLSAEQFKKDGRPLCSYSHGKVHQAVLQDLCSETITSTGHMHIRDKGSISTSLQQWPFHLQANKNMATWLSPPISWESLDGMTRS